MDDLVETARREEVDIAYLVDALEHYRRMYETVLREREVIEERAREMTVWQVLAP